MQKPQPGYTQFYREEGAYNKFDQTAIIARYVFIYPENVSLQSVFTIDLEYDECYDQTQIAPVDLAKWLEQIYKTRYMLHDHQEDIQKVVEYLAKRREKDKEELKTYQLAYAQYQIDYWIKQLAKLKQEYGITEDLPKMK